MIKNQQKIDKKASYISLLLVMSIQQLPIDD